MSKYHAVYDRHGLAYEYEDGQLTWMRPDLEGAQSSACGRSAVVFGDTPDIVSSIDGSVISGRKAMHEHCLKHNVVPYEDVKGLPPKTMNQEYKPSRQEREATKRTIASIMDSRNYR